RRDEDALGPPYHAALYEHGLLADDPAGDPAFPYRLSATVAGFFVLERLLPADVALEAKADALAVTVRRSFEPVLPAPPPPPLSAPPPPPRRLPRHRPAPARRRPGAARHAHPARPAGAPRAAPTGQRHVHAAHGRGPRAAHPIPHRRAARRRGGALRPGRRAR